MKRVLVMTILAMGLLLPAVLLLAATQDNPDTFDLIAGQNEVIGQLEVWDDYTNLYVTFVSTVALDQTQVHWGLTVDDIPQTKKGNPSPGKFDYSDPSYSYSDGMHRYSFTIPWGEEGCWIVIAAHAVCGSETVWAGGEEGIRFNDKNWSTYIPYHKWANN